jgi:hypothetical protein
MIWMNWPQRKYYRIGSHQKNPGSKLHFKLIQDMDSVKKLQTISGDRQFLIQYQWWIWQDKPEGTTLAMGWDVGNWQARTW